MKNKTFQNLFFKSLFIPVISVMCAILLIFFVIIDNMLYVSKASEIVLSANISSSALESEIKTNGSLVENISGDSTIKAALRQLTTAEYADDAENLYKLRQTVNMYVSSQPGITNALIFTPMLESVTYPSSCFPLSLLLESENFSPYFDLHSAIITSGSPYFSQNSILPDKSNISMMTKIIDDNEELLGVLFISISKEYLYKNCLSGLSEYSKLICDNNGNIICEASNFYNNSSISQHYYDALKDNNHGEYKNKVDTVNSCIIYSNANNYGLKVIVTVPLSKIYTWRIPMLLTGVLIIVILFALAYVFSEYFNRNVTLPINSMIASIKTHSKINIPDYSPIEFILLGDKYNELLNNQDKLILKLTHQMRIAKDAEIKALMAQINPHFLYNTLNSIAWSALDSSPEYICRMISKLAKLCRINYNFKEKTTLERELTQINLYLDLQVECFKKSFDFKINAPDNCSEYIIPSFILQPIVENSIIHGFSQLSKQGEINIDVIISDDVLISVSDNGCGIPNNILENLNSNNYHSEKYGIFNINSRIKAICGDKYGISYKSNSLATTANLLLPKKIQMGDQNV